MRENNKMCPAQYADKFCLLVLELQVMSALAKYLRPFDCIVDFSCGANEMGPMMNEKFGLPWRAFDIFPAQNSTNFVQRDWLSVSLPSAVLSAL